MTDEQIKQNAHGYTYTNDHNWIWDDSGESRVDISAEISDAYIAGAHSMLEEIKELEWEKKHYQDIAWQLAAENDQLRNPWISVKEQLPEREETLKRFSKDVLCALDNGEFYITDYFDYERNRWNSFPDSITHWMPIPELKEGE